MEKRTGIWQAENKTVYSLESTGFRRGQEVLENRFTLQVSGRPGAAGPTTQEVEDLAKRIAHLLNTYGV
jgi:hypothetical protein